MIKSKIYKTIKVRLKDILKADVDYKNLYKAIGSVNDLVILCYFFMRSYLLSLYSVNRDKPEFVFPIIDEHFIAMAFKVLSKESCGQKPKGDNKETYDKLVNYYNNTFAKIVYSYKNNKPISNNDKFKPEDTKFDAKNLSYIIKDIVVEMLTCINNNIQLNYFKQLNRFIKKMHKNKIDEECVKLTREKQKILRKEKYSELKTLYSDIINNTMESKHEYHPWIAEYKAKIVPLLTDNMTHEKNIDRNPDIYMKYMFNIAHELEQKEYKLFQAFPQRTEIIPKHININTNVLVDVFMGEGKGLQFNNIRQDKVKLWNKYFNINPNIYKYKNYSFDHQIQTNGYTVSLTFIRDDEIAKKETRLDNMDKARKISREFKNEMTPEEYEAYKNNNKKAKKKKEEIIDDNSIKKQEEYKKKFKTLSKTEQEIIVLKKKLNEEFPYIEQLVKVDKIRDTLKEALHENNLAVADPGKRSILYIKGMKGKDGKEKYFDYTNSRRLSETKRTKYGKLLKSRKKRIKINDKTIAEIETKLSEKNGKTVNNVKYLTYIKEKLKMNQTLKQEYAEEYYRKLKWYAYINRRKHENRIVNELKQLYGETCKFIIGDWNESEGIKYISTPGIGIKRKLREMFEVYKIDEYRTSKYHYKHEVECENYAYEYTEIVEGKEEKKTKEIHSVLIYKIGKESGCINRDRNGVNNMDKIVRKLLETKERPELYKREQLKKQGTKPVNVKKEENENKKKRSTPCELNPVNKLVEVHIEDETLKPKEKRKYNRKTVKPDDEIKTLKRNKPKN